MARLLCLLVAIPLLACQTLYSEELLFEQHIRPLLKAHCFHCHGEAGQREGGLDLRLRRLIVAGGDSGASLVPGDAAASLLLQRVRSGEMPPVDKKLTAEEITRLERWIVAGAKTARDEPDQIDAGPLFTEEERNFWSFLPIARPAVPTVSDPASARTPIDRFILTKLDAAGLCFSPEADRRTLARRVYFDLLGLPPSLEQVERFVADPAPDAYERLVDRVLASPHYGERWGRHWLDVAGYADSEGYTEDDTPRDWAYFYRDYVIASFNADKPFDVFVHEQLAGDELLAPPHTNLSDDQIERLAATGFLRMAPDGTAAAGVDQDVARNEVMADTIRIVSSSLMGMTVGCARCHDHRYDPIPTVDYYRLRAIFEPALDWKQWRVPSARRVSLYTDQDRQRAAQIEAEAAVVDQQRETKAREYIARTLEEELETLPEAVRDAVRDAYNTAAKDRNTQQQSLLKDYPSVANISVGSLYLYDRRREAEAARIDAARREKEKQLASAANPDSLAAEIQKDIEAAARLRAEKAADDLKRYQERADAIRAAIPPERFLRVISEPPNHQPATFVFFRGDHQQPQDEVTPAGLSILDTRLAASLPANDASLPSTGRRLAFAKQLTDPRYPLTARVIVNRIWLHHFGRGIVNTPADFGLLGERPTHPELLDWLAAEFMASGWRVKPLHRLILTSSVYRQAAYRSEQHEAVDPDNRLYARMSVRRLESEAVRDALLTVSDTLNRKFFGPPVPVMEDEVGQIVIGKENLDGERKPGEAVPLHGEQFRRSTYVQVRRSRPLGVLEAFDHPEMTPNCEQRHASNVAPQGLLMMNSSLVVEFAEYFAARVRREAGSERADQVRTAWQLALTTVPSEGEVQAAVAFLLQQEQEFRNAAALPADATAESLALSSFCQALLGSNRFLHVE